MCAFWIMPTSLAPSPIASVVYPELLTSAVTCAFCSGDTRQQMTAAHCTPTCRQHTQHTHTHSTAFKTKHHVRCQATQLLS